MLINLMFTYFVRVACGKMCLGCKAIKLVPRSLTWLLYCYGGFPEGVGVMVHMCGSESNVSKG